MKTTIILGASLLLMAASCKKNECHECHYDSAGSEVELGQYCGDDLKNIEANGYTDTAGVNHTVHCHEH